MLEVAFEKFRLKAYQQTAEKFRTYEDLGLIETARAPQQDRLSAAL